MTPEEITKLVQLHNALRVAFYSCGIKPLPDTESKILAHLESLGVVASADKGYLELSQQGTQIVVAAACERLRDAKPELFVSDPRRDKVTSREDFHGSPMEIAKAKSQFIKDRGLSAWENLPKTRAEAERKAVVPSPLLNRRDYMSMDAHDRAELAGLVGADGIRAIMRRTA